MGRNPKGAARRVALLGVLFALAAVLSLFEGALAGAMGLPPGVKPGLANTVVMFALLFLGLPPAACLAVLKALLALLTRGAVAGALSLCGGVFSVGVMWLLRRFGKPTPFILSASGALAHNAGQILVAVFVTGTPGIAVYILILAASGVVTGVFTGLRARPGVVCAGAGRKRAGDGRADGPGAARAGARHEKGRFFRYYQ